MNLRQAQLIGLAGFFFSSTAIATNFFIDRFEIQRDLASNPGVLIPWFVDDFNDGAPPPSKPPVLPNGSTNDYVVVPRPLPGPEQGGKLRLRTASGDKRIGLVDGDPFLVQRARLATNQSNADADLDLGLKETQVFTVKGTFDLIKPDINFEYYGVRLTDFGQVERNDNVLLRVILIPDGNWQVQFVEVDFENSRFDVVDFVQLSTVDDIGNYEQIALTLSKSSNNSKLISASVELIDNEGDNLSLPLTGSADIFDGERWARASFVAIAPDPRLGDTPALVPITDLLLN